MVIETRRNRSKLHRNQTRWLFGPCRTAWPCWGDFWHAAFRSCARDQCASVDGTQSPGNLEFGLSPMISPAVLHVFHSHLFRIYISLSQSMSQNWNEYSNMIKYVVILNGLSSGSILKQVDCGCFSGAPGNFCGFFVLRSREMSKANRWSLLPCSGTLPFIGTQEVLRMLLWHLLRV